MARRAASICRAVNRPRPMALRPYSPKLTFAPRVATPLFRPFCCFRYLVLAGCCIFCSCPSLRFSSTYRFSGSTFSLDIHPWRLGLCTWGAWLITTSQYLPLENPDLDSNDAISRLGFRYSIIQISPQGMKGDAPFAIPFRTRNFNTVQTPRTHYLDSLSAKAHGVLHGALHCPAEHDPLLQLLRDIVSDELRINFRFPDLFDVYMYGH